MIRTYTVIVTMAMVAAIVTSRGAFAADDWKLIQCGHVVDVERQELHKAWRILVKNDRIEAMGADIEVPPQAQQIDVAEHYCMPGLMETHALLHHEPKLTRRDIHQSSAYNALNALKNARVLLEQGFTTVRALGFDRFYETIELRNAINRGDFVGPRLLVSPHGHGSGGNVVAEDLPYINKRTVTGVVAIQAAVRRDIANGADWIFVTGIDYSPQELKTFADEAHRQGKKVAFAGSTDEQARRAAEAGADSIEYAPKDLSPKTIRLIKAKGIYLVPTFGIVDFILDTRAKSFRFSAEQEQFVAQVFEPLLPGMTASIQSAHRAGVKMALSGESMNGYHQAAIRQFRSMNERLNDSWFTLRAGTITAAEMLGLEDQIGSLEVGKQADIVAMPGNPVDDVRAVEQIDFVMKAGKEIRSGS